MNLYHYRLPVVFALFVAKRHCLELANGFVLLRVHDPVRT